MKKIVLYTTRYCGFCNRAKMLLQQKGLAFEEHPVDDDPALRKKVSDSVGGYRTVPMIFIDEKFIGGFTELAQLDRANELAE